MSLSSSNSLVPVGMANLPAVIAGKPAPHKVLTQISVGVGVHLVDLVRGQIVRLDGTSYIFTHATTDDEFCLQNERTGKMLNLTMDELATAHRQGRLVVMPRAEVALPKSKTALLAMPLSAFEKKTRKAAIRRARYCIALDKARADGRVKTLSIASLTPFIKEVAANHNDPKLPSAGSLIRWYGWWQAGQRRLAVLCHAKAKRRTTPRMKQLILHTLWDVLESYWATCKNISYQNVQDRMGTVLEGGATETGYNTKEYRLPALSTISLYAKRLNKYQVTALQDGVYEANRLFEPRGKLQVPTAPNVLWEVDHHRLKYEVSYNSLDRNGNVVEVVLGCPWLTVVIDVYSRVVLAIVVSFEPPSTLRTLQALKMAMLPKDELHANHPKLQNRMDYYGIPIRVRTDRGRDFYSEALALALFDLGIELDNTHAYSPWEKPYIERLFWTLDQMLVRKLPGHTPRPGERKRGPKPKLPPRRLKLAELTDAIVRFFGDVYHHKPHGGLAGDTPAEVWRKGMERIARLRGENPSLQLRSPFERSQAEFDAAFTIRDKRKLTQDGIPFENLWFNSGELGKLFSDSGPIEVEMRVDPANLTSVLIRHPREHRFLTVPCTEVEYATDRPLWSHRALNAALRKKLGRRPRNGDWSNMSDQLLMEMLGLVGAGPKATRRDLQQAARHLGGKLDLGLLASKLAVEAERTGRPVFDTDAILDLEINDGDAPMPVESPAVESDATEPSPASVPSAPIADDANLDPFAILDARDTDA